MPRTIYDRRLSIPSLRPASSTVANPLAIPLEPYLNAEVPVAKKSLDAHLGFGLILTMRTQDTVWSSAAASIPGTELGHNSTCYRGEPSFPAAIHVTALKKQRLSIRSQLRFGSIRP